MKKFLALFLVGYFFVCHPCIGSPRLDVTDSIPKRDTLGKAEKDIRDVLRKKGKIPKDNDSLIAGHINLSFIPAVGYTLQTGFAGIVSANLGFTNDSSLLAKLSSINTSITYSQYRQLIIPITANIWTKGNNWNYITDLRFINYPSAVYGLGGRTDPNTV